jgi:hypothetical protein
MDLISGILCYRISDVTEDSSSVVTVTCTESKYVLFIRRTALSLIKIFVLCGSTVSIMGKAVLEEVGVNLEFTTTVPAV